MTVYLLLDIRWLSQKRILLEHSSTPCIPRVCVRVLSHFSFIWLFATPWNVAHQAPLFMGFSRQEYWNGVRFPIPGDLPNPGIQPASLAIAGGLFTTNTTWEVPPSPHIFDKCLKTVFPYLTTLYPPLNSMENGTISILFTVLSPANSTMPENRHSTVKLLKCMHGWMNEQLMWEKWKGKTGLPFFFSLAHGPRIQCFFQEWGVVML